MIILTSWADFLNPLCMYAKSLVYVFLMSMVLFLKCCQISSEKVQSNRGLKRKTRILKPGITTVVA